MAVAESILHREGIEGVTLASVADRLGLTKQAIYHYFASKDALWQGLVTRLLDQEIVYLEAAIAAEEEPGRLLGGLIWSFHRHYADRLNAFRAVYCQTQLLTGPGVRLDQRTLKDEINPRTRHLFDLLERRLTAPDDDRERRGAVRRLAFSAWLAALGLMTMQSIAAAAGDPLIHADQDLLDTLAHRFDASVAE